MEKENYKMDETDKIVLYLMKKGILVEHLDYIITNHGKKDGTTYLTIEYPIYDQDRRWRIAGKQYMIKEDGTILEEKISFKDEYEFADLTDEEYLSKRVYRFVRSGDTFYFDKKKTIIDGRRKVEATRVIFEKDDVRSVSTDTRRLSRTPNMVEFGSGCAYQSYGDIATSYGNHGNGSSYYDDFLQR